MRAVSVRGEGGGGTLIKTILGTEGGQTTQPQTQPRGRGSRSLIKEDPPRSPAVSVGEYGIVLFSEFRLSPPRPDASSGRVNPILQRPARLAHLAFAVAKSSLAIAPPHPRAIEF